MKKNKERLDVLLVKLGLVETRNKAHALIMAGAVLVGLGEEKLTKPGEKIPEDSIIKLKDQGDHYVSRSAHKLLGALKEFNSISLKNKKCIDVGASTGGFTQVCLESGAKEVYAVDVGHNQLHWKIRSDTRVKVFEGMNMREVPAELANEKFDFACIDVSFISLRLILPTVKALITNDGEVLALIKPQHEVEKEQIGKGGIVKDTNLHEKVKGNIAQYAENIGFKVKGLVESTLKGTTGNTEFLIWLSQLK